MCCQVNRITPGASAPPRNACRVYNRDCCVHLLQTDRAYNLLIIPAGDFIYFSFFYFIYFSIYLFFFVIGRSSFWTIFTHGIFKFNTSILISIGLFGTQFLDMLLNGYDRNIVNRRQGAIV